MAEVSNLPFVENYFDIAAAIGVLEYYDVYYNTLAIKELNRVLKGGGKLIIDFPNHEHPQLNVMIEYENYLGRKRNDIPSGKKFQSIVKKYFIIDDIDNSYIMLKYFLRNKK